jgi:GAF domain-containing protein
MLRRIFAPPIFEDEEKTRIAALLNSILLAVIVIGATYTVIAPFLLGQYVSAVLTATIVVASLISRQLMRNGYISAATIILLTIFHVVLAASIAVSGGIFGASYFSLVMTTVVAGVLLGGRSAYIMAAINSLTGLGVMLLQEQLPEPMIPQMPITFWSSLVVYVFFIAALQHASRRGFDRLLDNLRNAQNKLTETNRELQEIGANLEQSVAERTAELDAANQRNERRAMQFEAISEVSRVISQTQSLESLLPQIAQVISQQFDFYHVGIFLLDSNNEYAVLTAANSAGGKKMLARNHKLKAGQVGIVGYVAGTGVPRIALDTTADAIYFNNPDLPETRSEMALPLVRAGKQIIGVLDVQSTEQNAFGQEDIRVLNILAEQVAIAIDNARLYEDTQKALLEAQMIYRGNIRAGWVKFVRAQQLAGVRRRSLRTNFLVEPVELPGESDVVLTGRAFKKTDTDQKTSSLTVPMKLRGEIVGVMNIKADDNREWNADELDIINAIIERAALSIENARLLTEAQKQVEKERAIGQISAKIGSLVNLENILQTTVQELGNTLPGTDVTIQFKERAGQQ